MNGEIQGIEVTSLGPSSRREDLIFIPFIKIKYYSKGTTVSLLEVGPESFWEREVSN
jgi:hypothetical protein